MSTTPKSKKSQNLIYTCEKCSSTISHKDLNIHSLNCPPTQDKLTHRYCKDGGLYTSIELKTHEEIQGILPHDLDNLVFVSQMGMQVCEFAMGSHVMVADLERKQAPCARVVWPTVENSIFSASFTKNGMEAAFEKETEVCISKIYSPVHEARVVTLVHLGKREIHPDVLTRIYKTYFGRLLAVGNNILIRHYGRLMKFSVKSIEKLEDLDKGDTCDQLDTSGDISRELATDLSNLSLRDASTFYKVVEKTKFVVFGDEVEYKEKTEKIDPFSRIGGYSEEINELRSVIKMGLKRSTNLTKAKGVLLYGSSGTGKTLISKALAEETTANVVNISLPDLCSKYEGSIEENMVKLLFEAFKLSPTLVVIDDIDAFCLTKTSRTESDKKIMNKLLNFFDEVHERRDDQVFILATSNKPDSIDPAFRRCGRLDREIEIPTPTPRDRLDILSKLLRDDPPEIEESELRDIANAAHGFVGSDLASLCSRASLQATKSGRETVSKKDFQFALTRVRPSAMREVQIEVPDVKWSDIGGQNNLKLILKQAVEWPLKHPDSFIRMGITPPRGVLMFGPPGCSKTMIAKALATESGLNFLSIKGPELFSKWVGESERAVREVFRKARQVAPSVIFFDEIDALGGERSSGSSTSVQERVLAQLLTEMDGVTPLGDVTVLAATNRPDRIDKALLRPGRLDRIVYVPLPDAHTREEIFKLKLAKMPAEEVDVKELVEATEGYSGAEVNAVCHEAGMKALEEDINAQNVSLSHFKLALRIITPRTPPSMLKIYEDYVNQQQ